jgi:cytochrome c oxidase subunit 2
MSRTGRVAAVALALTVAAAARAGDTEPRVVRIVAKKFSYTPSEIHLKKGEPVVLELVSEDRVHGFKLPAFKVRTDVRPNEVTRVPLTPDKAGTFTFACDVFCGDGHDDMTGTVVVAE